jgi:hypothetical protein
MKTYNVNAIDLNQLIITGRGDSELWNKAENLTDFSTPWESENKFKSKTNFKALWDGDYLFFCFTVVDNTVHINKTDDSIDSIALSDRVELFFRSDESLNPYYCLEIDPTPRIMDFEAHLYRKFDFNWNWPKEDLMVKSYFSSNGFSVEGKIGVSSLKELNLLNNNKIETGIYRAKYQKVKEAFQPTWITWVNPNTETPDFHIASSFGVLKLG